MRLIKRDIEKEFRILASEYPIITILGPRQAGKTTLARMMYPDKPYCSLENIDVRAFALSDPKAFLNKYKTGAILDEIQRAPNLLSYLQQIVDDGLENGSFILTGSHQLGLHNKISQSFNAGDRMMSEKLYNIISKIFSVPITEINDESNPETIESWDSLNLYMLIDDIETEFNVKFTLEEILEIKNVGDFKNLLVNHGCELNE